MRSYDLQSRHRPPQASPRPEGGGAHGGKKALLRCKGGHKRELFIVKGRIRWRKGRVGLESGR